MSLHDCDNCLSSSSTLVRKWIFYSPFYGKGLTTPLKFLRRIYLLNSKVSKAVQMTSFPSLMQNINQSSQQDTPSQQLMLDVSSDDSQQTSPLP